MHAVHAAAAKVILTEFGYALRHLTARALPSRAERTLDQFMYGLDNVERRKHVQLSGGGYAGAGYYYDLRV